MLEILEIYLINLPTFKNKKYYLLLFFGVTSIILLPYQCLSFF